MHSISCNSFTRNKLTYVHKRFFKEILEIFQSLQWNTKIKCIVISGGESKVFTAGLDLSEITSVPGSQNQKDPARDALEFLSMIKLFQEAVTSIENCNRPVIAAIHGQCIGGGIDFITACDIRVASMDTVFCIKEIDVGLAADIGTLQRLPKVVGNQSWVRDITFTARNVDANEAFHYGLISHISPDKHHLLGNLYFYSLVSFIFLKDHAFKVAQIIASKSPIAVLGTKHILNYSSNHSTQDGLDYVAVWNSVMLNTPDVQHIMALFKKKSKL